MTGSDGVSLAIGRTKRGEDSPHAVLAGPLRQLPLQNLCLALWTTAHPVRKTEDYTTSWATLEGVSYCTMQNKCILTFGHTVYI